MLKTMRYLDFQKNLLSITFFFEKFMFVFTTVIPYVYELGKYLIAALILQPEIHLV